MNAKVSIPIAALVSLLACSTPSVACIFTSEAEHDAMLARDRAAQAGLVAPLAKQAETIVIAQALGEVDEVRWTTEYLGGRATKYRSLKS